VTLTWDNATNDVINGCNALNTANGGNGYAGVKIWRLPTRQELETLADYGKATTAINTIAFPATVTSSSYWSSTASATATTTMWGLEFTYGTNSNITKTSGYYVRCVYGQSKDTTLNFTDNANGTVTDNTTGLIWQKCSMGQNNDGTCSGTATTATWAGALTYCNTTLNNLPSSSPRTWRLPNINELKTILDITKATGATTNTTIFPATVVASVYWSSTTLFSVTSDAWNASFNDSSVTLLPSKNSSYYVRCVSGP
jgi:hypothetical protein